MLAHKQDKTTLLPQVLRERIEKQAGPSNIPNATIHSHNSYLKPSKKGKSRKTTREEERAAKKQRKAEYFAQRPHVKQEIKPLKRKGDEQSNERPVKRRKMEEGASLVEKTRQRKQTEIPTLGVSKGSRQERENAPKRLPLDTIKPKPTPKTTATTSRAKGIERHIKIPTVSAFENDEDKEIAWLEHQLGIRSGKRAGRSSTSYSKILKKDGLDDLLEGLDGIIGGADEESDLESESGSQEDDVSEDDSEEEETAHGEEDGEEDDEEQEDAMITLPDEESILKSAEERNGQPKKAGKLSQTEIPTSSKPSSPHPTQLIKPLTASKYVPPHLRSDSAGDDPNRIRLLRQLKGLINRLSEQNIGTVISELEQIYRQNTRYDVTSSLTSVIIEAISSNASLLDNHIALNASLVAALYRIVGIEFAAYFVQEVVKGYEAAYGNVTNQQQDASNPDAVIVGKDAQNLLVCIAELYNFDVVSCVLVYDIVRALLKQKTGELEVELLLKILRIGGRQLRQDDPLALKDIVQLVTENVSNQKGDLSSRTRFMMETLTNLKNNWIKKKDSSSVDTIERMKKVLSGLSKKHHGSQEPLRVTLADLRSADSKGKWWLVSSGWGGDPLADIQRAKETSLNTGRTAGDENAGGPSKNGKTLRSLQKANSSPENESEQLLQLARVQGMNTDIRRSVFVVLMSSDDYVDACDRLSQLTLTEQQQREIVRVLVHCCGNEKAYNPYYALVGQRLLATSHAHRITAQFSLWDFLRSIGETGIGQRGGESFDSAAPVSTSRTRNLAKFYGWLIIRGSLSISVLRPIEFTLLQSSTLVFLDTLFYDIFTNSQGTTPILSRTGFTALWQRGDVNFPGKQTYDKAPIVETFMPAVRDANLGRGLVVYLNKFIKRRVGQGEEGERRFFKWAIGIARDVLEVEGSTAQAVGEKGSMDWEE